MGTFWIERCQTQEKTIEALGEKINDLAEDKQELVNEKYAARKHSSKRRRRR
jgi:hypothetical protein